MAAIILPQKDEFTTNVATVKARIQSISQSNGMAKLLYANFQNWLKSSAMSPVKLTQDLDVDKDGFISGDEFASLLGQMTGEKPPEWVVEVVFSFVNADPSTGIPVADWMAFLAASGLEIPEELFVTPVIVTGSVLLDNEHVHVNDAVNITVSFNEPVESYGLAVTNRSTGTTESFETKRGEMDDPTFDEFVLESDEVGEFTVDLLHTGVRLDSTTFTVHPRPVLEEEPMPAEDSSLVEDTVEPVQVERVVGTVVGDFSSLLERLHGARLRSDTEQIIAASQAHRVRFTVLSSERTLLGEGAFRNGTTLTCEHENGERFELMMQSDERTFAKGEHLERTVVPHAWSMALRHLVCREG